MNIPTISQGVAADFRSTQRALSRPLSQLPKPAMILPCLVWGIVLLTAADIAAEKFILKSIQTKDVGIASTKAQIENAHEDLNAKIEAENLIQARALSIDSWLRESGEAQRLIVLICSDVTPEVTYQQLEIAHDEQAPERIHLLLRLAKKATATTSEDNPIGKQWEALVMRLSKNGWRVPASTVTQKSTSAGGTQFQATLFPQE